MLNTKLTLAAALSLALVTGAQAATDVPPPPSVTEVKAAPVTAPAARTAEPLDMSLAPTEKDMERARKAAKARQQHDATVSTFVSKRGTRIEEHHDQNNRLTEVRVTPGTTQIPYTMENKSDRPINNTPGTDSRSTLGTPQFFKHTW